MHIRLLITSLSFVFACGTSATPSKNSSSSEGTSNATSAGKTYCDGGNGPTSAQGGTCTEHHYLKMKSDQREIDDGVCTTLGGTPRSSACPSSPIGGCKLPPTDNGNETTYLYEYSTTTGLVGDGTNGNCKTSLMGEIIKN